MAKKKKKKDKKSSVFEKLGVMSRPPLKRYPPVIISRA